MEEQKLLQKNPPPKIPSPKIPSAGVTRIGQTLPAKQPQSARASCGHLALVYSAGWGKCCLLQLCSAWRGIAAQRQKKSRFCQLYALTELHHFQVRRLLLAKSSCSSRSKAASSELEHLQQPPAGCRLCSPAPAHSPRTTLTQHHSTQHPVQDGSSICLRASAAALHLQTQRAIHLRSEDPLCL